MTSTRDTTGHPDVTELSDLTEGLLAPSRSAELHRHLDDCALCADTHASLEEIRGLLGTFAEPVPMPDDVAQRIDAALAAEAAAPLAATEAAVTEAAVAESAVSESTPLAVSRETQHEILDVSRETQHDSLDVSRETSAADRPSGRARATTGPGRKDKIKDRPRIRRRTAAVLGVFTAAALGLGSVLLSSLMSDGDNGTTNTASDTFSKISLPNDVAKLLPDKHRTAPSITPRGEVGIRGNGESPKVLQAVDVPACVQQGTTRTDAALATKPGVYEGKDVLLVVFPHTTDTRQVDAYLVDTDCVKNPATQADVLLKATYARP